MRMRWTTIATMTGTMLLAAAPSAHAIVDVTRASDGVVWVRGDDTDEQVTIDRADDGRLRIADTSGAPTASDATCAVDAAASTVLCDSGTTFVRAVTAGGTDSVDATEASLAALIFNGGAGADTVKPTGARFARVWDPTTTDTVDVSALDGAVRARWNKRYNRVMLDCRSCSSTRRVLLSGRPGTVILTSGRDDVDLRPWRVLGTTTWRLGDDRDQFLGSNRRRSNVFGGDGADRLVSFAARDVLRGEGSHDKLGDFGGSGDRLLGGDGLDLFVSLDGSRDVLDGGGDRDMCASPGRSVRLCDGGTIRGMEHSTYTPIRTRSYLFDMLGIT